MAVLDDYMDLINSTSRIEYMKINNHLVDLDDCKSEAYMAVLKELQKNKPMNTSYVATCCKWAIRNLLRNGKTRVHQSIDNVDENGEEYANQPEDTTVRFIENVETKNTLAYIFNKTKLNINEQKVLVLWFIYDVPNYTIAKELNISVSRVSHIKTHALRKLKEALI